MTNDVATLKAQLEEELRRVPQCVINGGQMMAHEWKIRAMSARKLCDAQKPKVDDLKAALHLMRNIDKYEPSAVPVTSKGRRR